MIRKWCANLHNPDDIWKYHPSAPIAWPIARLLDVILGRNEQHTYKKAELKSFLQFHRTGDEPLRDEELAILNAVLELNTKKVETVMTPLKVSYNRLYYLIRLIPPRTPPSLLQMPFLTMPRLTQCGISFWHDVFLLIYTDPQNEKRLFSNSRSRERQPEQFYWHPAGKNGTPLLNKDPSSLTLWTVSISFWHMTLSWRFRSPPFLYQYFQKRLHP